MATWSPTKRSYKIFAGRWKGRGVMARKKRIGIFDLGRIPVTEVKREDSVGTLAQYRQRLAAEEQQAKDAEQARFSQATAETGRILSEINVAEKELTKKRGTPVGKVGGPTSPKARRCVG